MAFLSTAVRADGGDGGRWCWLLKGEKGENIGKVGAAAATGAGGEQN